jgi:hypothetical protein
MSILFSKAAGAFADCDDARQRDGAKQRRHQINPMPPSMKQVP